MVGKADLGRPVYPDCRFWQCPHINAMPSSYYLAVHSPAILWRLRLGVSSALLAVSGVKVDSSTARWRVNEPEGGRLERCHDILGGFKAVELFNRRICVCVCLCCKRLETLLFKQWSQAYSRARVCPGAGYKATKVGQEWSKQTLVLNLKLLHTQARVLQAIDLI
jgi:hypothetical protein